MFNLNDSQQYYLCSEPTDMRKGFDCLCGLVHHWMHRDPFCGEVFVFYNRERNRVKLLHWERGGLVIYHKRLEKGRFSLPKLDAASGSYPLLWRDMVLMIEGVSFMSVNRQKRYDFLNKKAANNYQ